MSGFHAWFYCDWKIKYMYWEFPLPNFFTMDWLIFDDVLHNSPFQSRLTYCPGYSSCSCAFILSLWQCFFLSGSAPRATIYKSCHREVTTLLGISFPSSDLSIFHLSTFSIFDIYILSKCLKNVWLIFVYFVAMETMQVARNYSILFVVVDFEILKHNIVWFNF